MVSATPTHTQLLLETHWKCHLPLFFLDVRMQWPWQDKTESFRNQKGLTHITHAEPKPISVKQLKILTHMITKVSNPDTKHKYKSYFHQGKNRKKYSIHWLYSTLPEVNICLQIQNVTSFGNGVSVLCCKMKSWFVLYKWGHINIKFTDWSLYKASHIQTRI